MKGLHDLQRYVNQKFILEYSFILSFTYDCVKQIRLSFLRNFYEAFLFPILLADEDILPAVPGQLPTLYRSQKALSGKRISSRADPQKRLCPKAHLKSVFRHALVLDLTSG